MPTGNRFQTLVVALAAAGMSACGPAQRIADGSCYYAGKGVLQVLGTVGDTAVAWAEAEQERQYQQNQIQLQQLRREFQSVDLGRLESDYRVALATGNYAIATDVLTELNVWTVKAQRAERLQGEVERYQAQQQAKLEQGPGKSLSQLVDESGNCVD